MIARSFVRRLPKSSRYASTLSDMPAIAALPFVGSFHKLFGPKAFDGGAVSIMESYDAYYSLYKKYGPIYTMGFPGVGVGIRSIVVTCVDPVEYAKVLQNEGHNPSGFIQNNWPLPAVTKHLDTPVQHFFTQGEKWRRLRMPTQKALLSLSTVNGYLFGICKAAADASPAFKWNQDQVNIFTNQCAFDVFCSVAFGKLMHTSTGATNSVNQRFCENAAFLTSEEAQLGFSFKEQALWKIGWTTPRFRKFSSTLDETLKHCKKLISEFTERRNRGELNDIESQSYTAANLNTTESSGDALTEEEFMAMTGILLLSSVDSTSGVLVWVLINLALHPDVQEKARQEILSHISQNGNSDELAEILCMGSKKVFPYLSAVIRESHRIRPAFVNGTLKMLNAETELLSYTVPAGVPVNLDHFSLQNDPDLVENPLEFRPERWLQNAVDARKGTPAEVIDHHLMKEPFSAGSRMCPAHRVARVEIIAIIATLLRKFNFTIAPDQGIKTVFDIKYWFLSTVRPIQVPKFNVTPLG